MSNNTLLISVQDIKDRTGLHANGDEKLIYPDIKYCQDCFILPILGTALMTKLQTDISSSGQPSGNYLTLWSNYIKDALTYYVLSEVPTSISFQLYNKGVVRKTSENTTNPDMQDIIDVANKYKARAEYYGQRLADYLLQNHTLFTEYDSPGNGVDTIHPEGTAFKTSFYLGPDCNCSDGSFTVAASNFKKGCR